MPGLKSMALTIAFVAWLAAAGVVIGFCLVGLLGPRIFGSLGGHGLGDLGYLFGGAAVGAVVGVLVGVRGSIAWTPQQHARVATWAGLAGLVVAGVTTLLVNSFGAW